MNMKKLRISLIIIFGLLFNFSFASTLNLENLWKEINKDSIICPEIVFRQSILETGWLKSNLCLKNNNLFGFRNSKGYMKFKTWESCVAYYKKWQLKRYKSGNYYVFLEKIGYATSPKYVRTLKQLKIPSYARKKEACNC